MYKTQNLSHADALQMVDSVRRRLEADNMAAAIAVTDSHGELVAFLKMDGCRPAPVQIAINKAFTAARESRPSGAVGEAARASSFPITNYGDLRYTGWAGGLPVVVEGQTAGAIGISGIDGKSEVELCAFAVDLVARKE
jgi:glc operon protein GlcG